MNPFTFPRTGHIVRNRSVLAAMTNKQSHADGILSDEEINWLVKRAEGGFGIITTAATHVVPEGQGWDGEMGVWGDHQLPGLTRMADESETMARYPWRRFSTVECAVHSASHRFNPSPQV